MGFGPKSEEAKTQGKPAGKYHFMRAALNISFIRRMTTVSVFLTLAPRISLYMIHEYRSLIVYM